MGAQEVIESFGELIVISSGPRQADSREKLSQDSLSKPQFLRSLFHPRIFRRSNG